MPHFISLLSSLLIMLGIALLISAITPVATVIGFVTVGLGGLGLIGRFVYLKSTNK